MTLSELPSLDSQLEDALIRTAGQATVILAIFFLIYGVYLTLTFFAIGILL